MGTELTNTVNDLTNTDRLHSRSPLTLFAPEMNPLLCGGPDSVTLTAPRGSGLQDGECLLREAWSGLAGPLPSPPLPLQLCQPHCSHKAILGLGTVRPSGSVS